MPSTSSSGAGEFAMLEASTATWNDHSTSSRKRFSSQERQVRLAVVTWPALALLGASVAAAPCLLGECDRFSKTQAKQTLVGSAATVKSLAFQPGGALLSSVGVDGSLVIWDLAAGPRSPLLSMGPGQVRCAAFSPKGGFLATARAAAVVLGDLGEHELRARRDLPDTSAGAACVAFAPDGSTLAVGQQDGKITLWDTASGCHRSTLAGHTEFVASLVFAPKGALLASSSGDQTVRIWDLSTSRQRVVTRPSNSALAQAFSPDGRFLAQCDQINPVVRLCEATTGAERALLRGPSGAVLAVAISPDGNTLAAADFKGTVTFWDLAALKIWPKRLAHQGVRTLAFAPDGRTLATGGFDGTIHVWDMARSSWN
jgi:WD40 repeat protein